MASFRVTLDACVIQVPRPPQATATLHSCSIIDAMMQRTIFFYGQGNTTLYVLGMGID